MHSVGDNEPEIRDISEFEPLSSQEQRARRAILEIVADQVDGDHEVDEDYDSRRHFQAVASSLGVYDEEFVDACAKEAVEICIGIAYGVGPKARIRDRVRWHFYNIKEVFSRE